MVEQERLRARVHGRVQGVNFRHYTIQEAQKLDLSGWVKNLPDGTVQVIAEGPRSQLQQLVTFLHKGSPSARVDQVERDWEEATGEFNGFRVKY